MDLNLYGHHIRMACMDAKPTGESNGRAVVLQRGMHWFGESIIAWTRSDP